jgi:hypothetical protein
VQEHHNHNHSPKKDEKKVYVDNDDFDSELCLKILPLVRNALIDNKKSCLVAEDAIEGICNKFSQKNACLNIFTTSCKLVKPLILAGDDVKTCNFIDDRFY